MNWISCLASMPTRTEFLTIFVIFMKPKYFSYRRTFVNIVPTPFVKTVVMVENKPFHCQMLHHGECSCWIGHLYNQNKANQELYHRIQGEMQEVEFSVAQMKEFRNLKEFAVVYQPWTVKMSVSFRFVSSVQNGFRFFGRNSLNFKDFID